MFVQLQKFKITAVIIALILIPLVYSFFYLYAFWDPYSKLKELPVAVVNEDVGADINGTYKNAGQQIVDKLKTDENLKWIITDGNDANTGLKNRKYYASILIPREFSSNISTAAKTNKTEGIMVYTVNEKRNYLASQVLNRVMLEMKDNVSKDVTKEIVGNVVTEVKKIPDSMNTLNDGLVKLSNGSGELYDKLGSLENGQQQFNNGLNTLNSGIQSAKAGSGSLKNGSQALYAGTKEFSEKLEEGSGQGAALSKGSALLKGGLQQLDGGITQLAGGMDALKTGSSAFYTGTEAYAGNMKSFTAGLNQYSDSVQKLLDAGKMQAQLLEEYTKTHPEALKDRDIQSVMQILQQSQDGVTKLEGSGTLLKTAASALLDGTQKLEDSSSKLNDGIAAADENAAKLSAGAGQISKSYSALDDGVKKLSGGMSDAAKNAAALSKGAAALDGGITELNGGLTKLNAGSGELYSNAGKLIAGEQQLYSGAGELKNGIKEAYDGVASSTEELKNKVSQLDGFDTYAAEPVKLTETRMDSVPDYGTAFSPYFISLSLWVGALMMLFAIHLDPKSRFRTVYGKYSGIFNFARYAAIGIIQAVVLALVLKNGLKLEVKSNMTFYLACILISMTFVAIVQFFIVNVGEAGKFLAIVLLILQLTACGGTFPMELVPGFFNAINPFMPMTYSVNALREVISGTDHGFLNSNLLVLASMMVVFLLLSVVMSIRIRSKERQANEVAAQLEPSM